MKRVLIGALALAVVAIAGCFGVFRYVQHRAEREVEVAFDQLRSTGAKASHGKVAFDPWTRTLSIHDIQSESASQPPIRVKIGSLVATGVSQPDAGRLAAASIESNDLEIGAQAAATSSFQITYKAPSIIVKDYAGPARGEPLPAGASPLEAYGFLLKQFAEISATSVSAPTITGTLDLGNAALGQGEFTYAGLALEAVKDGRIGSEKIANVSFKIAARETGQAQTMTGQIADIVVSDIDTTAIIAALAPEGASDDQIHRVYRQASTGRYEVTSSLGLQMHMDGISIEGVGLRPSRLQARTLMALMTPPATPPSPAQIRELADHIANLYEGLSVENGEMHGLSITTPQGPVKLSRLHADLQDGKANLAIEGLDGSSPRGPVKLGRLALKALDIAGIARIAGEFADPARRPAAAQALALLKVLQGAELKDFVAPYKATNKQVKIDTISLDWGQFVGPIPTSAQLTAKMNSPIDASNAALQPLLAAGIDTAALDAAVGAGWNEGSGTFALTPVRIELANLVSASGSVSLAHVPRALFTTDPQAAMGQAAQIDAGGLELSLHDLGVVDLLIASFARMQSSSRDDARQAILAEVKATGEELGSDNPDVAGAVEAVSRFIETPHQTLTLKLIPRARVPALQLIQLLRTDPPSALAQFRIEASTGL